MPRRVVEQSSRAADLVTESVSAQIGRVPSGMIYRHSAPAMAVLKTLASAASDVAGG